MKMKFLDFVNKVTEIMGILNISSKAHVHLRKDNSTVQDIQVEFYAIDKEGRHLTLDSIDKIEYDILDPKKITIHLS